MANCVLCNVDFNPFPFGQGKQIPAKIARVVDSRRVYVCSRCINKWDREQKSHALNQLHEYGGPHPLFMIGGVWTRDPADKDYLCFGHLLFAKETVCFIQISEFNKKTALTNRRTQTQSGLDSSYVMLYGAAFGGVGGAFMGAVYSVYQNSDGEAERGKGAVRREITQSVQDQIEETQKKKETEDLASLLEKAQSLFLYPKKLIESISYDRKHGLKIRNLDPSCKQVSFELDEDVFKKLESRIQAYLKYR